MSQPPRAGGVESKVAAGSGTFAIAGWISSLILQIPWVSAHTTTQVQQQLPVLIAWALGTLAAWLTPHTDRPVIDPATVVVSGTRRRRLGRRRPAAPPSTGPLPDPPAPAEQPRA